MEIVDKMPKEQRDHEEADAYATLFALVDTIAEDPANRLPSEMDETLCQKEVASNMVLFYVNKPVKTQKDIDDHARLFDAYYSAVGRADEDNALRAYIFKRTLKIYQSVYCEENERRSVPLRLCSVAKKDIPKSIKTYIGKFDKMTIPQECPPDSAMLSWVGYVTRLLSLQNEFGLFHALSKEWVGDLLNGLLKDEWVGEGETLRMLEIGSGSIPWLGRALVQLAADKSFDLDLVCVDSGASSVQPKKLKGVSVLLEDGLETVRERGPNTDVLLLACPNGWDEDGYRLREILYQYSVGRTTPARVIFVGEPYSVCHANIHTFRGWAEMFFPDFEVASYRSWAGFRTRVICGHFIPRCQSAKCMKATIDLKRCTTCLKRWYCSTECQKEDWTRKDKPEARHAAHCKADSA